MTARLAPEHRRSQLIDTTVALLEQMPAGDIVAEYVAARAGVSRGLVYRYFSGTDELVGHARRRFFRPLCGRLERAIDESSDPLARLRAAIAETSHFAASDPARFCNAIDGRLPRTAVDDPLIKTMLALTLSLRPGQWDAHIIAAATAASIETGIVTWLLDDDSDADVVVERLFDLVASGLRTDVNTDAETTCKP